MANKREETFAKEIAIDNVVDNEPLELVEVPITPVERKTPEVTKISSQSKQLKNCLRKEKVVVKHINKQRGMITNPKHVLYGGMAETAKRVFTVPLLRSGSLVDVLTKDEKDFLEYALGLEPNALSVYIKGEDNFWSTANPHGIARVVLKKHDNYFDLSDPTDYIKVKILLANKDKIAPSLQVLQDTPKATYEFVIVSESDTSKMATTKMSNKKLAYKLLGKLEQDIDTLRFVIETIDGRPTARSVKMDALQVKADEIIQQNAALFLRVANDDTLPTKVLIKKAIEAGIISKRGDYHYLRKDNTPLCELDQEPTLNIAAQFLLNPKHQEIKFSIEAALNK